METNLFAAALGPAMSRDNTAPDDLTDEEGLRVCAVCGERKQAWFEVEGLIARNKVPCMCKCERDRLAAEEEARKRQEMALRIDRYRRQGMTDEQYRGCTFDADDGLDGKASATCRKYVKNWERIEQENIGLLLWGDVGGGKTFYAACIANALIDKGIPVVMTTLQNLVAAMQKDFGSERETVLNMLRTVPLLILDDIGTERNTSTTVELVYEIINTRYKAQKPLIVTTNLTMTALKEEQDTKFRRLYERIVAMCGYVQKVSCTGRRQAIARSKMELMKQIFEAED